MLSICALILMFIHLYIHFSLYFYRCIYLFMSIYSFACLFMDYFTPFSCLSSCLMIYLNFLIYLSIILLSILSIQHTFYLLILYIYLQSFFLSVDELICFNTFLYHQERCSFSMMSILDFIIINLNIVIIYIVYL